MTSAMSALAVSMGSACSSGTPEANPVLKAIGFSDREIGGTLRLSVGRTTTPEQIDLASRTLIQAAQGARTTAID
jgi:cysteine desulfurase